MFVIIKNISTALSIDNLKNIITDAIAGDFFHKNACLHSIKIIRLVNRKKQEVDRYAIVRLDSEATEKHLIAALKRKRIDGKAMMVDRYVVRHWSNDRRIGQPARSEIVEKRKGDRRRKHLKPVVYCEFCETVRLKTFRMFDLIRSWFSNKKA